MFSENNLIMFGALKIFHKKPAEKRAEIIDAIREANEDPSLFTAKKKCQIVVKMFGANFQKFCAEDTKDLDNLKNALSALMSFDHCHVTFLFSGSASTKQMKKEARAIVADQVTIFMANVKNEKNGKIDDKFYHKTLLLPEAISVTSKLSVLSMRIICETAVGCNKKLLDDFDILITCGDQEEGAPLMKKGGGCAHAEMNVYGDVYAVDPTMMSHLSIRHGELLFFEEEESDEDILLSDLGLKHCDQKKDTATKKPGEAFFSKWKCPPAKEIFRAEEEQQQQGDGKIGGDSVDISAAHNAEPFNSFVTSLFSRAANQVRNGATLVSSLNVFGSSQKYPINLFESDDYRLPEPGYDKKTKNYPKKK